MINSIIRKLKDYYTYYNIKINKGSKPFKYIIVHHSYSPDSRIVPNWNDIYNWHTGKTGSTDVNSRNYNPYIRKPMRNIGYHFGIEYENNKLTIKTGRSLDLEGGHCLGFNNIGIGICLIGNYDIESPNQEQMCLLKLLCKKIMQLYPDITVKHILGHRETYSLLNKFQEKSCPGKKFGMNLLRQMIESG